MARVSPRPASSADVAAVRLWLIDPWASADRNVEEDDPELHRSAGLVAADVHARGKFDERVTGAVGHRVAVVVVHGERSRLHRHERLAWVRMPAGRRVRSEGELRHNRVGPWVDGQAHPGGHGPD